MVVLKPGQWVSWLMSQMSHLVMVQTGMFRSKQLHIQWVSNDIYDIYFYVLWSKRSPHSKNLSLSFIFQPNPLVDKFPLSPCYPCGMDPATPPTASPKDNPACLPDFVGRLDSQWWLVAGVHRISMTAPPWANLDIPCVLTWTTEIHLISFAGVDNGALKVCGNTHCAWHDSWAKFSTQSLTKILSAEYQC